MVKLIRKIRKQLKHIFDGIRNERLKLNLLQALPFWVASLVTGLVAVFYAKLFAYAESGASYVLHHHSWWYFIIAPVCFVIAWWLVYRFAPNARGSGIPPVIAAIELATPKYIKMVDKLVSLRIIFIKIVSSVVFVFGGGVVGREGPTIQIACSIFRKINLLLPDWWPKISKRNMIMTGAAAGLAAAFNTPLGGIVFAVEELTKTHISYFKTALFTAVIIAGLTAQGLLGPYLYLGYPTVANSSPYIFLGIVPVAIIAGFGGSLMCKLILSIVKWKRSLKLQRKHVIYSLCCGLGIISVALFIDQRILGSGKELMAHLLFTSDKQLPWYLPLMRIGGSIFSFTTAAAGGVFAPALASGASIGAVIAEWFHLSAVNSNLLILSGMVAFLTGVTRTPFTSAILVLEMTDRHNVIFYLMLAGMVASLVSMLVDRHSFYDHLKLQYIHDLHHEAIPEEPITPPHEATQDKPVIIKE